MNGQQRRVDAMKQETLAWTLRYKLGLTGTKLGCDRAECEACTVLIDDVSTLLRARCLLIPYATKTFEPLKGLRQPNEAFTR